MPLDLLNPGQLMTALIPDLVLAVGTLAVLLFAGWRPASDAHQRAVGFASLAVLGATLVAVALVAARGYVAGAGPIAVDGFRWAADAVLLVGAILTTLMAIEYQRAQGITAPESHVLVLLATSGMMLLVAARDLTFFFLGIVLM